MNNTTSGMNNPSLYRESDHCCTGRANSSTAMAPLATEAGTPARKTMRRRAKAAATPNSICTPTASRGMPTATNGTRKRMYPAYRA